MNWGTISGGPINLFTWNSLYPYNYASNYGGQYQFNVMPMSLSPQQAFNIQNVFNPFYQFNRMMNIFTSAFNPFQNMQQIMLGQAAYSQGQQMGEMIGINSIGNNTASNIAGLKSQLESAIASDNLTTEQKNELRELKRQVEALEDKLADIVYLRQSGATNEQLKTALQEINSEYRVLRDKVQEVAERIQTEIQESEESEDADDAEESEESEESDNVQQHNDRPLSNKIGNLDTVSFNEDMISADVDDDNVREIVNTIFKKVDGVSLFTHPSSYIKENINKDNVVEVMLQWNKSYAEMYKDDDKNGLIETLCDEWGGWNPNKQFHTIIDSLNERLQDYKDVDNALYNEVSAQLNIAKHQLRCDGLFGSKDKLSQAINKAHKNIVILMAKQAENQ